MDNEHYLCLLAQVLNTIIRTLHYIMSQISAATIRPLACPYLDLFKSHLQDSELKYPIKRCHYSFMAATCQLQSSRHDLPRCADSCCCHFSIGMSPRQEGSIASASSTTASLPQTHDQSRTPPGGLTTPHGVYNSPGVYVRSRHSAEVHLDPYIQQALARHASVLAHIMCLGEEVLAQFSDCCSGMLNGGVKKKQR